MLEERLNTVNMHHHTLVAAAAAYPEVHQRDQYQEAIDWLRDNAEKLEATIEYHRKQLFDTTEGVTSHEENPVVAKLNPYVEHTTRLNDVYLKRYQLDNDRLFANQEEGNA